ncbi:MAG: hypothetical protein M0Z41_19020, partial [Peptococcaceae bacterium]|nr:hypothetical protein [Peptococcaceae bacterium]
MNGATVLSEKQGFMPAEPCSGRLIADGMAALLQNLGSVLSRRGKIIGHLKAMAVSGENFIQMSLTSLPHVGVKADPDWYGQVYHHWDLTITLIVFGFSEAQLRPILAEALQGTVFASL